MDSTILIADRYTLYRDCMVALFNKEPGLTVLGTAATGKELFRMIQQLSPAIVIADINMQDFSEAESVRELIARFPGVKLVLFSTHQNIQLVMEMFNAGVSGYLHKNCGLSEMVQAIHTAMDDRIYLNAFCLTGDSVFPLSAGSGVPVFTRLTDEELSVFRLISEGKTAEQIASILRIKSSRAEDCRSRLKSKLNMHNVSLFMRYAAREEVMII